MLSKLRRRDARGAAGLVLWGVLSLGLWPAVALPATTSLVEVPPPAELSATLKEKYLTPASKFYQVDDVKVHVRDEGSGPVIVMLHDAGSSLQVWDSWAKTLSKTYRVIRIDEPGNGLSGTYPSGEYVPDRIAKTVGSLIEQMALGPVTLVGGTFGGYYAARYAVQHPQQVQGLVMIAPAGYPAKLPAMLTYYLHNNDDNQTPPAVALPLYAPSFKQTYGDPSRIPPGVMERNQELSQLPGNRKSNRDLLRFVREFSKNPEEYPSKEPAFVKQLTVPVLIMWGQLDHMISVEKAKLWKRDVPQAQVIIYPDAGHSPMEEIPDRSLKDLLAFIQAVPAPSSASAAQSEVPSPRSASSPR